MYEKHINHIKRQIENVLLKKLTYRQYKFIYNAVRYRLVCWFNIHKVDTTIVSVGTLSLVDSFGHQYLSFIVNNHHTFSVDLYYMPKD